MFMFEVQTDMANFSINFSAKLKIIYLKDQNSLIILSSSLKIVLNFIFN